MLADGAVRRFGGGNCLLFQALRRNLGGFERRGQPRAQFLDLLTLLPRCGVHQFLAVFRDRAQVAFESWIGFACCHIGPFLLRFYFIHHAEVSGTGAEGRASAPPA